MPSRLWSFAPLPLALFPAVAGVAVEDARLHVQEQLRAAAAALIVLEEGGTPPAQRAERLLVQVEALEALQARRAAIDPAALADMEAGVAASPGAQSIALRLLRALERCAAADYEGSPELKAAVERLVLVFEGEMAAEGKGNPAPADASPTPQSGAE